MNLFRLARVAGVLSMVATGLTGCLTPPSYPDTPEITFESIRQQRFLNPDGPGSLPRDSVFVTINFQDGDGDLGLTAAESKNSPYSTTRYGNTNFHATAFLKNTTTSAFDSLKNLRPSLFLTRDFQYERFEHLSSTTDNRKSPLRGTLTRAYGFTLGSPFLPGDEVKFRVSIFDRALRQSNTIETSSIVIAPR